MQFEEFDKKIKEAAEHHHPAYDEQAWTKMEKLLNKHLPQKGDDRRRLLFIILLFLGLGGAGILITKPWKKNKKEPIAANQTVKQDQPLTPVASETKEAEPVSHNPTTADKEDNAVPDNGNNDQVPVPSITTNGEPVENNSNPEINRNPKVSVTNNNKDKTVPGPLKANTNKDKPVLVKNTNGWRPTADVKKETRNKNAKEDIVTKAPDAVVDPAVDEKKKPDNTVKTQHPVAKNDNSPADKTITAKADTKKEEPAVIKNNTKPADKEIAAKTDTKKDEPAVAKTPEKKDKEKKKKQSSFFFSLSAGPDLSFVSNNKAGSVKLLAGIGLGYNYKDRLTIRTGFYSARKVYTANPDAYDPPAAFFSLYPYLEKVDADCKVYEIPVSVSYNFGKKTSGSWFVSAGLSTFLMNEETYNYHYKYTPLGNTYTNEWTIKNKNSHFFSVATVSAGYKKDIGKRVTLIAEPYFKIPLGGVGYGKVKLNSGGVLFTVGIKPF